MTLALDIAAGLAALLWLAAGLLFLRAQSRVPSLEEAARRPTEDPRDDQPPPRVAAVVAGRDDADTITDTVADLLAQRAVEIRVVGVDDRSADDTLDRLNDLARSDPRLVPVRVDALPEGWLGKPHALTRGVEAARADEPEWLFFTDSDVRFEPDALALAIRAARRMNAHHLCAMPGLGECAVTGEANLLMHAQAMATQMARVNADRPGAFVGVGAFNLVRVCAYDAVGGHNTLRMEIVEDVKLGLLLSAAGFRSRGVEAPRHVRVAYAPTIRRFIGVLEKNLFAMLDFNTPMTVALLALYLLILLAPFPAALTGSWIGLAGVAAIWTCALAAARQARRFGWPMWPALLSPLCLLVPPVAVTNSMIRTLARGGVTWRDTFYPLDALRKGLISPRRPESLPERRPGAERPPIAARRA